MSTTPSTKSKVLFRIPEEDGSTQAETLWATPLGNDLYKLDNSPFYAYSVSWEDVVFAPFDPDEEFPTFQSVVSKSGNRTLRIILQSPPDQDQTSNRFLQDIDSLGCSYEGCYGTYYSINVPPEAELERVREFLISANIEWEYADPAYSELHPGDA